MEQLSCKYLTSENSSTPKYFILSKHTYLYTVLFKKNNTTKHHTCNTLPFTIVLASQIFSQSSGLLGKKSISLYSYSRNVFKDDWQGSLQITVDSVPGKLDHHDFIIIIIIIIIIIANMVTIVINGRYTLFKSTGRCRHQFKPLHTNSLITEVWPTVPNSKQVLLKNRTSSWPSH